MSQPEENIVKYDQQKIEPSQQGNEQLQAFTYIFQHRLKIYKSSSEEQFRIKRNDFDIYCFNEIERMRKSFIEQANIIIEDSDPETETSSSDESSSDLDDLEPIEDLNPSNQDRRAA